MDKGGALGVLVGPRTGENGGKGGADILAHNKRNGHIEADDPGGTEGLKDPGKGGGTLEQGGEESAYQHTENGVGKGGEKFCQPGFILKGSHCLGHGVHADEKKPHTNEDLTDAFLAALGDKHVKDDADHRQHRSQNGRLKSGENGVGIIRDAGKAQNLGGDGGADVGAHDDANRLLKLHNAGVYKAYAHDGGGGGRVNDGGDKGAQQNAFEHIVGQPFQNPLQPSAGYLGQTVGHSGHTKQKQCDRTQHGDHIGSIQGLVPLFC